MHLFQRLFDGKILKSRPFPTRYDLQVTPLERLVVPAVATDAVTHDRIDETAVGPHTAIDYMVRAENVITQTHPAPVVVSSLTPDKCRVYEGGYVRQVSEGQGMVRVETKGRSRDLPLEFTQSNPTVTRFKRFADGTLGRAAEIGIDPRIAGKNPVTAKPVYSSQNHADGIYVRNPDCWAAGLVDQLTCFSPWNSRGANTRAGTKIAPSFVILAAHFTVQIGDTIRFVDANNNVITRTIADVRTHPGYGGPMNYDVQIAKLNAPLPASIHTAPLLPPDADDYWTDIKYMPLMCLDQEEKALVFGAYEITTIGSPKIGTIHYNGFGVSYPATPDQYIEENPKHWAVGWPDRAAYYEHAIVGDSGNPWFLVLGDTLILFSLFTSAVTGPLFHRFSADIQAMMDAMGNEGQSLTFADLSAYQNFNP